MRKILAISVSVGLTVVGILWRGTAAPQAPAAAGPEPVTVLITMGLGATAEERWDGSARVSGGTLRPVQGWHFSAGDSTGADGTWKAQTRRDSVAPYADIHYTEMRPGAVPPVLHQPIGVVLTVDPSESASLAVDTQQGSFELALRDIGTEPVPLLNGRATAVRVPSPLKLSAPEYEDDEPSIAVTGSGPAVAWVAYQNRADRVLLREFANGAWGSPEEVTPKPADIFRCSVVSPAKDELVVVWSQRSGDVWQIWSRWKKAGRWAEPKQLTHEGSNTFPRAAASREAVYVAWQSFRGGQSDIYLIRGASGSWDHEWKISTSPANDWEPDVAASSDDRAFVVWDGYDKGNYDVFFREFRSSLGELQSITTSPRLEAHATVAVDPSGKPWVAWDESGVNWGKDQGFLIPTPLATPLHQQRAIGLVAWDGKQWTTPRAAASVSLPEAMRQNAEHPRPMFDGKGTLQIVFRHWTRNQSRTIGSGIVWENYVTSFDGAWTTPRLVPSSGGSIEKNPALARAPDGDLWLAYMTDNRPFATNKPDTADVMVARLDAGPRKPIEQAAMQPFVQPPVEAIPVHTNESADVRAVRSYTISNSGKSYKIYRGDMHRHTDVSQDFKYDGSLLEVYRYGLDAAGFDYIVPTDHQTGYDMEFTWWQNEKLVDLFQVSGAFTPLYGSERSLRFPNGHRNTVFARRGVRPLPIPPEEAAGKTGAAKLYEYLKKNGGISMPHSSATDQGTDWRDNDPEVEPLVEIYQGYRNSYEYEGAPRAATSLNLHAQKSGWQPSGFWWNALAKGYKLGVQASSDHWSTHLSYACIVAEKFTREGLLEAMKKRHAYAATDNIIVDFQARTSSGGGIMGDVLKSSQAPVLRLKTAGTGAIKQIDLIKDRRFIYTTRPGTKEFSTDFTDRDFGPGEHFYYMRVLQEDGQLAWSSPIWITRE